MTKSFPQPGNSGMFSGDLGVETNCSLLEPLLKLPMECDAGKLPR